MRWSRRCVEILVAANMLALTACKPNVTELLPDSAVSTLPDLANLADQSPPFGQSDLSPLADAAPPRGNFNFCPTSIDVFGGTNAALVGCGGIAVLPAPLESGYFSVGTADYDATLAGRLQSRLAADPDLIARFGATWKVRDCAADRTWLQSLVAPLPADSCGADTPTAMGSIGAACTNSPAQMVLLVADNLDDRCHGGGGDSAEPDNQMAYADHFSQRLDMFLMARQPLLSLVGPKTNWQSQPPPMVMPPPPFDPALCHFPRADWNRAGIMRWKTLHPNLPGVFFAADLHDEFIQHNRCCQALGVACLTPWFSMGQGDSPVNCDGAQAIVDFWYAQLKAVLLGNDFHCN